jgi:hypothetical protein
MSSSLPALLATVGEVEIAGRPVEREAPREAKPVTDHLPTRPPTVDVDAEQLGELRREPLAAVARIPSASAVPDAHVEAAVLPELELAAAVPLVRLAHEEQLPQTPNRAEAVRAVLDHARVAAVVGVGHVEAVIGRVPRVKRKGEESLLGPRASDETADVEERLTAQAAVHHHPDAPGLLRHVEPVRLAPRGTDPPGASKARGERAEPKLGSIVLRSRERHRDRAGCEQCGGESHRRR